MRIRHILWAFAACCMGSNIDIIDNEHFESLIKQNYLFVYFYTLDSSHHSTSFVTSIDNEWMRAAKKFKNKHAQFGSMDCMTNHMFCKKMGIHHFPAFYGFVNYTKVRFDAQHDATDFLLFAASLDEGCTSKSKHRCTDHGLAHIHHVEELTDDVKAHHMELLLSEIHILEELRRIREIRTETQLQDLTDVMRTAKHTTHHNNRHTNLKHQRNFGIKNIVKSIRANKAELRILKHSIKNPEEVLSTYMYHEPFHTGTSWYDLEYED